MKYQKPIEFWVEPKTGKPRYDFEAMYKNISDPWGCSKNIDSLATRIFLETIFSPEESYKNILDIGCGMGDLSNLIYQRNILNSGGSITAMDISNTAINQAKIKYPEIYFTTQDLLKNQGHWSENFDLITMAEVLWYLVVDLELVIQKLNKYISKDGKIVIKQFFPSDQKYFKEYLDSRIELITLFETHSFRLITHITSQCDNGELVILKFTL